MEKINYINLCLLLCIITQISQVNSFTFSFKFNFGNFTENFNKKNYKNVVNNPYRVFNLAPWSSMKAIRSKYKELVRRYHPDKNKGETIEQFETIQTAYETIKKDRQDKYDKNEEIGFSNMLRNTISSVFNIELFFGIFYIICSFIHKFQMLIVVPLIYQIISFTLIDNLIPHWFDDLGAEYFWQFVCGLGLFLLHKIIKNNLFPKKEDKKN